MKRIITLVSALALIGSIAAQGFRPAPRPRTQTPSPAPTTTSNENIPRIEIMPFGGYMFGGNVALYNGDLDIKGNGHYGIALGVPLAVNTKFELSYFRMDTKAEWNPYIGFSDTYDVAVQYFQAGMVKAFQTGKVKPFGTFSLGATWFENKSNRDWNDQWAFSAVVGAGVRIEMTDQVALRLQGRFMVPMYFDGIGLGIGTGGVSGGAYFGSYALQGDFSAGLVFKIW